MDVEDAISALNEVGLETRGATATPGHTYYDSVKHAGTLKKCDCGQKNLNWTYPEYIHTVGDKTWAVHRNEKTNVINCGPNGYHSDRYGGGPPCG